MLVQGIANARQRVREARPWQPRPSPHVVAQGVDMMASASLAIEAPLI